MANRTEQLKSQVEELWRGAVKQASGVRAQLRSQTKEAAKRVRGEIDHLRKERSRLLTRLGEQTLAWVNARSGNVPTMLKPTVDRLNTVVARLVHTGESPKPTPAHHAAEKTSKRPASKRAPAKKKTVKRPAKQPVARRPLPE